MDILTFIKNYSFKNEGAQDLYDFFQETAEERINRLHAKLADMKAKGSTIATSTAKNFEEIEKKTEYMMRLIDYLIDLENLIDHTQNTLENLPEKEE